MSGFAMNRFAGRPAAAALVRYLLSPRNPLDRFAVAHPVALAHMNPCGLGLFAARKLRKVELVQSAPVYAAVLAACAAATPLKKARKVGSGDVPGAPV